TPPLLYRLLSPAFALGGPTAAAARYWPALSGVAVAALTAATGVLIGGARVGLMAGLMVAANLGIFLHARLVEPDVLFIAFVTLAYAGFAAAYLGRGGRRGLAVFYAGLALAAITKAVVLAVGAVVAVGTGRAVGGRALLPPPVANRHRSPVGALRGVGAVRADFLPGVAVQARSRRSAGVPRPRASRRAGVGRHAGGRATRAPVPNAPDADLRGGRRRRHHRDARLARGHRRASTTAHGARRGHAQPRPAGPGVAARIAGARIGALLLERDLRVRRHRARRGGVAR